MKAWSILLLLVSALAGAQPTLVTTSEPVAGQEYLKLSFDFADRIVFEIWDKKEVLVEVTVEIDGGEHNDIFSLSSDRSASTIYFEMDKDMWDKVERDENRERCHWQTNIDYKVYLPKSLLVTASTISGDYEVEYYEKPMNLTTISGAIDITVPRGVGMDFFAETISGEIYSDLQVEFPNGKEGLRQIVGHKIKGRINDGGEESKLETISGNIYLREG